MKIAFHTLGCKVNQYDTQVMLELLQSAGHEIVEYGQPADVCIINTCTVTHIADKKSRQAVSHARETMPGAKLVLTGCYAQSAPEAASRVDGVDLVAGISDRNRIAELVETLFEGNHGKRVIVSPTAAAFEESSAIHEGKTRAHLKIQEGCDRYCSYCIIPYARGRIRSRTLEGVRQELLKLDGEGFKEVVLTGIHLMSYGRDLEGSVGLIDAIDQAYGLSSIRRVRLGSLEPQLSDEQFIDSLVKRRIVCRHFHLSLQSGSDTVLTRMNRRYTTNDYMKCVDRLREAIPGCAITTDIIVGFPGETEKEFEETLRFAEKARFSRIHVFPYSKREGTAAARMPDQIQRAVKTRRAAQLIELGGRMEYAFSESLIDTFQEVLVESYESGYAYGYTDTYVRIKTQSVNEDLLNTIIKVKMTGRGEGELREQ